MLVEPLRYNADGDHVGRVATKAEAETLSEKQMLYFGCEAGSEKSYNLRAIPTHSVTLVPKVWLNRVITSMMKVIWEIDKSPTNTHVVSGVSGSVSPER
jgi:hypothetical protein